MAGLDSYGERILLPDGLRVKLTNSDWRNAHENGDDTGVGVFCNGSRFSRRGAVANARTMHLLAEPALLLVTCFSINGIACQLTDLS
jgi:hypothetical protein